MNISKEVATQGKGPGEGFVGRHGIILVMVYLVIFSFFLLYSIMLFWPSSTPRSSASNFQVNLLLWNIPIPNNSDSEIRSLFFVALAGALGGLVHSLRSFYWYVGHRVLRWSWLVMYILLPFVGATLGLVFYLIVRGGLFSPQVTAEQINPFGFAALSALAGLFSIEAALKLQDIAGMVLKRAPPGADQQPQNMDSGVNKNNQDEETEA